MSGIVYGIGLGPGDPELLTLRAHRLIRNAQVLAYPTLAGQDSFARSIAAPYIPDGIEEIAIDVPMSQAREPAQKAYDLAAQRFDAHLCAGRDVVALCEGDPMFYGSFMYIAARLQPKFKVVVIPGVTSLTACAASLVHPLCAREQALTVLPATLSGDELHKRIKQSENIAIMKVGRHLDKIKSVLADLNLLEQAQFVAHASLSQQKICPLATLEGNAPYFSIVLLNRTSDPWL